MNDSWGYILCAIRDTAVVVRARGETTKRCIIPYRQMSFVNVETGDDSYICFVLEGGRKVLTGCTQQEARQFLERFK